MADRYYDSELTGQEIEDALAAINGVISATHNGKVLAIENGKIVPKSVSEFIDVPVLEPININENGDYYPQGDVDGFDEVHVSVMPNIVSLNATANGVYNPTSGVDGYGPVIVNVSGGGGTPVFSGTENPPDTLGTDGSIFLKYFPEVIGFTRLEYMKSQLSDTYIDTGVMATSDISVEMEYSDFEGTGDRFLFGYRPNSWNGLGINNNSYSSMYVYYGNVGNAYIVPYTNSAKIKLENGKFYLGNTVYTRPQVEFSYPHTIYIFATNNDGSPLMHGAFKFKNMKIWSAGTLIRDYYPVKRNSDNELGLYDYVNSVFYSNDGSGTFEAGQNTVENPITDTFLKVNGSWTSLIGSSINDVAT